jgi:hypothetical protein
MSSVGIYKTEDGEYITTPDGDKATLAEAIKYEMKVV